VPAVVDDDVEDVVDIAVMILWLVLRHLWVWEWQVLGLATEIARDCGGGFDGLVVVVVAQDRSGKAFVESIQFVFVDLDY